MGEKNSNGQDVTKKTVKILMQIIGTVVTVVVHLLGPILIVILILTVISSIIHLITTNDGSYSEGDTTNVGYVVSQKVGTGATVSSIEKKENGYGYNLDLDKAVKEIKEQLKDEEILDRYISKEKQDEYLKNFIRADIKTKYPDLRSKDKIGTELGDNELQGAIQIFRSTSDEKKNMLEYIDSETFENYVKSNDKRAIDYFTLNDYGNLVISTWSRTISDDGTETYNLGKDILDYRDLVKRYDMPFDFLWALTVMGEDAELANEVSELAKNTKIEITIYEDVVKTTTVTSKTDAETGDIKKTTLKYEECENHTYLTYADTWLAEVKNEYTNTKTVENSTSVSDDLLTTTTKTIEKNKYVKGTTSITEKTDENSETDNFITLLKKHENAMNSILSAREWFYEMLESSDETADMVNNIDYMLDIVDGKKTGKKMIEEEFEEATKQSYLTDDIIVETKKSNDNIVLRKDQIEKIITTKYPKVDNQKRKNLLGALDSFYKIQTEWHVNAVFAIAVTIQESNAGTSWDYIASYTHNWVSYKGSGYIDRNGTSWKSYSSFSEAIEDFGKNIATKDCYFAGNNITVKQIGKSYCSDSWSNKVILIMKNLYSQIGISLDDYIEKGEEDETNGDGTNITGTTLLEIAKQCHEYIAEHKFVYGYNNKIPYPNDTKHIDCSAYVCWVLYEYGYTEFEGLQKTTAWFMGNGPSNMGWTILKANEAKAGDLLVKSGHMEIFVGDGVGTYGAGSDKAIAREISYPGCSLDTIVEKGGFTRAIRVKPPNK